MTLHIKLQVKDLGVQEYADTWEAMQTFTDTRDESSPDELWCVQHTPVFTMGKNAKPEHLISPGDIPVIQSDRGGQVTYHGPGQLIVYVLLNLGRKKQGVRQLVTGLENAVIELLKGYNIAAESRRDAPGVYVQGSKIAALGLRVRKGCSYHGIALNVDMDLSVYDRINPCGYQGLRITQLKNLVDQYDYTQVQKNLVEQICKQLEYNHFEFV